MFIKLHQHYYDMNKVVLLGIIAAITIGAAILAIAQTGNLETADIPSEVDIQESNESGKNISIKLSESISMKSSP